MMRWFPDRTITDLYVWMSEHRGELEKELGWAIRPEAAAEAVIQSKSRRATAEESKTGSWRKARLINRYSEHLFRDILVPVGKSTEGWDALEQVIQIAQREQAHIQGLHVVGAKEELSDPEVMALQDQFHQICEKENVQGVLAVEVGDPTQRILARAALTDLIVMKISYPPSRGIRSLASHIRTLITRCPRPILAVPGTFSKLNHALVAFDGSPKAKEALFVATYMTEQWHTNLAVFTGLENEQLNTSVLEFAKNYLEFNEVEAHFITQRYTPETFKATAEEINADLIIMGGYSGSILKEMTVGSSVNFMLRETLLPVLICR